MTPKPESVSSADTIRRAQDEFRNEVDCLVNLPDDDFASVSVDLLRLAADALDEAARLTEAPGDYIFSSEVVEGAKRIPLKGESLTLNHVCHPEQTDERTVTCPVCHAVYVLDEDATADERSYGDA